MIIARFFLAAAAVQLVLGEECDLSTTVPWPSPAGVTCQPYADAYTETYSWLRSNMPPFDSPNTETLFVNGVASVGVTLGLRARQNASAFPWAKVVPKDVYLDYVAPYGNVNEGRSNWRTLLQPIMGHILSAFDLDGSIDQAQEIVNGYANESSSVWTALTASPIVFKSEQTPLIYDPMSTLTFSFASCTGISILFIDALRSIGVPARLAGTPAWNGDATNGNHNWVEIWRPSSNTNDDGVGVWSPIEGKPAGGGESLNDPCTLWFCNPSRFPSTDSSTSTKVYAAKFNQTSDVRYPMAWDLQNDDVPGIDVSQAYSDMCAQC
jgi:hypothetical protein